MLLLLKSFHNQASLQFIRVAQNLAFSASSLGLQAPVLKSNYLQNKSCIHRQIPQQVAEQPRHHFPAQFIALFHQNGRS
jgi:hypothetical protein